MIIIPIYLLSLIYFGRKEPITFFYSILSTVLLLILHSIFVFESGFGHISYFISDEQVYLGLDNVHQLSEGAKNDRWLWFFLTQLVSNTDPTGGLFSKLISLPLIPMILFLFYRIVGDKLALIVFFIMPYSLYIMQTALRDSFIVALALSFIFLSGKPIKDNVIYLIVLIAAIFLLRPFFVVLLILSSILAHYIVSLYYSSLSQKLITSVKYILISLLTIIIVYLLFKSKLDQYLRNITYFYEHGLLIDSDKTAIQPSLSFDYFSYSIIRYVFTPFPSSLIERILSSDVTQFGYLDDLVRVFNQASLLFLLMYLIIRFKSVIFFFKKLPMEPVKLTFIIFVFLNSILYSLYYAGGGHSRLKVFLFLGVFMIFVEVKKLNERK